MKKITNITETKEFIAEIKKHSTLITNIVANCLESCDDFCAYTYGDAVGFTVFEKNRDNLYFASGNEEDLICLLKSFPKEAYCDVFFRTEEPVWERIMTEAGWRRYARYYRTTVVYKDNPNTYPLTGRRAILQQLYDPGFGEVASYEDIPELMNLYNRYFDAKADDYYNEDQWKDILNRGECLIHREEGEISTVFVYRLEKNKLYNSMILNNGPANWSYNLERRVLDEAWDKGIRIHYWWTREENIKAVVRQGKVEGDAIKSKSLLYNDIYTNIR